MRRIWGGYTVIEVMIVLAVTGVLFSSAVLIFHGQQAKTSISQNTYDLASKLESFANEVNSGIYSGSQAYNCSISGGKASLSSSASDSFGSNDACLFLGRVVQVIPGTSTLYVYTVIGNRDIYNGGTDTGKTATQLEDTTPQVARAAGSMVLVNNYNLPSDLQFSSTTAISATTGSSLAGYGDLVGLYTDIADSGGAGTNLETIAFPFGTNGGNTPYSTFMAQCVELQNGCASTTSGYGGSGGYQRISKWNLCLQTTGAQAEVKVKASNAGISTEVDTQSCS